MISLWLIISCMLTIVATQAPGDENEVCTVSLPSEGLSMIDHPPYGHEVPLMDSNNYEYLLPPHTNPVWQQENMEGDDVMVSKLSIDYK